MINSNLNASSRAITSENIAVGSGIPLIAAEQNHVIDPTFFFDVIEEFSFNFIAFIITGKTLNASGKEAITYSTETVRGSLQSSGTTLHQSFEGNTNTMTYNFYCKSLYRLDIDDVILYKNNYLMVTSVQDYDEYGCRQCTLEMIQLRAYRDLADYVKYLEGEKTI